MGKIALFLLKNMAYSIKNNLIFVSKEDFNIEHTLCCGQIFSFKKVDEHYVVYSLCHKAELYEENDIIKIVCDDVKYFENFFDLKTDYSKIKQDLNKYPIMKKPIEFGYGIRILKNNKFEALISFIISANNNIKRIQKIIEDLKCKYGEEREAFYAFPTRKELLKATEKDFLELGTGYRAKYLYKVLRQIDENLLEEWDLLDTPKLREKLISLAGVGPKVADCIMLFGYYRQDVFPVDTWIAQMYNEYFDEKEKNRIKIRQNLVKKFGNLSGYAQQYLFYYQRSGE